MGATTSTLILSVLEREPAHGYRIVQIIDARSGGLFEWQEGTIYPALHNLEKSGLISGGWQAQPNGRRRRVYSLTAKGKKALGRQTEEWRIYAKTVTSLLEGSHV